MFRAIMNTTRIFVPLLAGVFGLLYHQELRALGDAIGVAREASTLSEVGLRSGFLKAYMALLVVAASLGAGLAVTLEPRILSQFPGWAQQLFGSGIMTGTLAAILAQALSAVELDDQIPEELYRATAQVIAFVLSLRGELRRPNRDGHRS